MYREEENKTLFLSEPRKVNKPIHKSEPSQVNKQTLRVNLSDNDSIMMFEWAKGEQDKIVIISEPDYEDYYKQHKWTLQINKSMAWSGPEKINSSLKTEWTRMRGTITLQEWTITGDKT